MPKGDKLEKHRRHLLDPPDEFLREKLPLFKLGPEDVKRAESLVVVGLRKPVRLHPAEGAKPKVVDLKAQTRRLRPQTLDELKELVGTPSRAFKSARPPEAPTIDVDPKVLRSLPKKIAVAKLSDEQRGALLDAGRVLLYGPADARLLARAGYRQVADAIIRLARDITFFYAPDLVVGAGETVTFSGYGVLYFHNVLIYGNGRIRLGANTKLHAYQVKHV